ncbi:MULTISPECIES: hypothetical protein [unclassified Mesorhizobium]|nr:MULTISPECIES: hypothetical protein [unclassified Mesorhizobium]
MLDQLFDAESGNHAATTAARREIHQQNGTVADVEMSQIKRRRE